jgi:hypothetical protein
MRSKRAIFALALLLPCLGAGPAAAQRDPRGAEADLARDFLALELAGWRLPDPMMECIEALKLSRLEPGTFGASEMAVDPLLVDPPGPHARIVAIEPDPADRRQRIVRFEWLVRGRAFADRFVMVLNDAQGDAAMMREPDRLVVRRECFGG